MQDKLCLRILKMMANGVSGEKREALEKAIKCVDQMSRIKKYIEENEGEGTKESGYNPWQE